MWSFTDKGLKEAVIKNAQSFKPKDPKDAAHYDASKSAIVAAIIATSTNGVSVNCSGQTGGEGSRLTVGVSNLKLTV